MGWEFSHPCFFCLKSVPSPRGRVVVVLETVSKATTTGGGIINYFVLTKIEHHSRRERSLASVRVRVYPLHRKVVGNCKSFFFLGVNISNWSLCLLACK